MKQGNRVFVLNMRGEPLMPCSQRKARVLLKEGKAVINRYNPFTIQLTYATGETKQDCHIGVDTGAKHIGIAVTSEDKVFYKVEIELRLDVSFNLDSKRIYRRSRRNRKCRYRKPRFLNRKRTEKWLPNVLYTKQRLAKGVKNLIVHRNVIAKISHTTKVFGSMIKFQY